VKTEEKYTPKARLPSYRFPQHVLTEEGIDIAIRPVCPEDAPRFGDLLRSLSEQSIYFRFFAPLRHFPEEMLVRLTRVDSGREIALAAIDSTGRILGIGRVMLTQDPKQAEFSVLVRDAWQGKGIGAELLKRCLLLAKQRRVEMVWGRVLPENTKMLALGKKLGFVRKRVPDSYEYELVIDLNRTPGSVEFCLGIPFA